MTTTTSTIDELYTHIARPAHDQQLRLLKRIADGLVAADAPAGEPDKTHDILEFAGVGAHNPIGMDAQEYIDQMRDEWDDPQCPR